MKIYIDLLILINFIYDFMILTSVSIILKKNINFKKLLYGSLIGSLSLITLFINFNNIVLIMFKIILSIIMNIVTFGKKNIIENIFYFYIITIILGGSGYLIDNNIIPLFLSPLILFFYVKEYKKYKKDINKIYKVVIIDEKETYLLNGYMDTGNILSDPIFNLPVIMISNKYKFKNKKYFYVPYKVINGSGIIKCIKVDQVIVDGIIFKCLVGFVNDDILKNKDVILNDRMREKL